MKRYLMASILLAAWHGTSFAQSAAPSDGPAMPGKVVSGTVPFPPTGITHTTNKFADGGCTSCAEPCTTCPTGGHAKHNFGGRLWDWLSFHGTDAPCGCRKIPAPYQPPVIAYFACKGGNPIGTPSCAAAPSMFTHTAAKFDSNSTIVKPTQPVDTAEAKKYPTGKPLSVYAPGADCKTCTDAKGTLSRTPATPKFAVDQLGTTVSGYTRLGGK